MSGQTLETAKLEALIKALTEEPDPSKGGILLPWKLKAEGDLRDYLMKRANAILEAMKLLTQKGHYYCEDSWYSCPKAEEGCADDSQGEQCNCGADEYNAKLLQVINAGAK